jgi:hypothetical protein
MSRKTSTVFLGLLVGALSLPSSFAAANSLGAAGGINTRADAATHKAAAAATTSAAQKKKAAALKKKKLQQQQQAAAAAKAKKAKEAQALKAQQEQKKKWYEDDRDRGLDIASEYAPKTIARIRDRNYIAKGDTVRTGNGKTGWQHYMDKYYSR